MVSQPIIVGIFVEELNIFTSKSVEQKAETPLR
jgi:hypothetical protein